MISSEFDYLVEQNVTHAVCSHFPLDWKEDSITHQLLIGLRSHFRAFHLNSGRHYAAIDWEIYKFHGRRETAFGDIGLLVRYAVPGAGTVEGAGFLEAKLRGRDTTKFTQVRHDQVARILKHSSQARLLLYDYNAVAVLDPAPYSGTEWEGPSHRFPARELGVVVTHAPVLPLQLAAALNHYDDSLYRFSHSFAHQLRKRYFQLHDLDFSESAVQAVKGFPTDIGSPNYVMSVRITPIGAEPPEPFSPNENLYARME